MPKKTRKMKQRAAMRRSEHQVQENVAVSTAAQDDAPERMRPIFSSSRPVTPFTYDYSHIYGDLRRIALFAGFFFAVLIALSFIIK